jgi:hypothetical protein
MRFKDYTLLGGKIQSQRETDTAKLDKSSVQICQTMLAQLRRGDTFVTHGQSGIPDFGVSLGMPDWLTSDMPGTISPGKFFTVADPGREPFQYNMVMKTGTASENDKRDLCTIMGLSMAALSAEQTRTWERIEAEVEKVVAVPPFLATALVLTYMVPRDVVVVAGSFSTSFAAALLLEEEPEPEEKSDKSDFQKQAVAKRLGVSVQEVIPADAHIVRSLYKGPLTPDELRAALQPTGEDGKPVYFWRVGTACYLDDPTFSDDLVSFADLRYNEDLGIHVADA